MNKNEGFSFSFKFTLYWIKMDINVIKVLHKMKYVITQNMIQLLTQYFRTFAFISMLHMVFYAFLRSPATN